MKKMLFSKDHEWVLISENEATVGITDHAQNSLGDIVYIEFPEVGSTVEVGEAMGSIESVKAVSELFSPVNGEILEINEDLEDNPGVVNEDPYEDGWIALIKINPDDLPDDLLSEDEYNEFVKTLD